MFVQEISRDAEGWDQFERDEFQWVTHRDREQWRGVGVGIAKDKFDCVLHKIATKRGIWVVARILGIGRIVSWITSLSHGGHQLHLPGSDP